MAYSINHCVTMIRGCTQSLKKLTEDMETLNQLKKVMSELTSKVNQGNKYLKRTVSTLHSRVGEEHIKTFSGETANEHFSALGRIERDANNYNNIVESANQEIEYRIIYLTQRINDTNNNISYWNDQLRIAEMEEDS